MNLFPKKDTKHLDKGLVDLVSDAWVTGGQGGLQREEIFFLFFPLATIGGYAKFADGVGTLIQLA